MTVASVAPLEGNPLPSRDDRVAARRRRRARTATGELLVGALVVFTGLLAAAASAIASVDERSALLENGTFGEFDETNELNGSLGNVEDRAYEGRRAARATYSGGGVIGYARGQFFVPWKDGEEVWYGGAFYLPVGFTAALQDQVDFVRWDNFESMPTDTEKGGVVMYRTGAETRTSLVRIKGTAQEALGESFDVPEGRWFWLEVHQRLSATSPLSEAYVDGELVASSTDPNSFGHDIQRLRYGIVATGPNQSNPLELLFDRAIVSHAQVGKDTAPPDTSIVGGPSGSTAARDGEFTFEASESDATFECQLNGGMWEPCVSPRPHAGLPDGPQTLGVRATDPAGNVDASPATRSWTVDTQTPRAELTGGPSGLTGDPTPTFSFTSADSGVRFECRLNESAWAPCVSPHTTPTIADGIHAFSVRAVDAAGNADPEPPSRSITVDTQPPRVSSALPSLMFGSHTGTRLIPVRLTWTASDARTPVSSLLYSIHQRSSAPSSWGPWNPLLDATRARETRRPLDPGGLHQFRTSARDAAGNTSAGAVGRPLRVLVISEAARAFEYRGSWRTLRQSSAYGGSARATGAPGGRTTLSFRGRSVGVMMPLRSGLGAARLCLDPGTRRASCRTVDLSPASNLGARKVVFARNGLNPSVPHRLVITRLSGRIDLDGAVVLREAGA